MNHQRNKSIQIVRIVAMFMIMFDHIITFINIPGKSFFIQVTNAGTLIFVFVSGLLFGERNVDNWANWIRKRLLRICVPMWITILFCLRLEQLLWGVNEWKKGILYIFNIQGIFGVITSGAHLWFLTLIMVCYLLTPLLSRIKKRVETKYLLLSVLIFCFLQITVSCFCDINLASAHSLGWWMLAIIIYFIGYMWGSRIVEFFNCNYKRVVGLVGISIVVGMLTVLLKQNISDLIIYNKFIIFYSLSCIELCIFVIVYCIGKIHFPKLINMGINLFDKISYEMYLVHMAVLCFITIPIIKRLGVGIYIILTIVLSIIISILLHLICSALFRITKTKKIDKKGNK